MIEHNRCYIFEAGDASKMPKKIRNEIFEDGSGNKVYKGTVYDTLDETVLVWCEESSEILVDEIKDKHKDPKLTGDEMFFDTNHMDCSGSPGSEEQIILNQMTATHPYFPKSLIDQLVRLGNEGHYLQGFSYDRKIGIGIFQNEEGRRDAEMSSGLKRAFEPKTLMVEGETIIL